MATKKTSTKTTARTMAKGNASPIVHESPPAGGYVPEAAVNDTLAKNRACPVVDAAAVPHPPSAYRATDPKVRSKRLRKLEGTLRSEASDALREAAKRGAALKTDLGTFAPDPAQAAALVERLGQTSDLVTTAEDLVRYARELDQIAAGDAVLYLEAENKEYKNALSHNAGLATRYAALKKFFDARGDAVRQGRARAKKGKKGAVAPA
jgi:hypothetical protein